MPTDRRMGKQQRAEPYDGLLLSLLKKRKAIRTDPTACIDPEDVTRGKVNQTRKDRYCGILLL